MKKFSTLLLALMAVGTMSAQNSWTFFAADSYSAGSGTKGDPYQITTPEELAKIAKDCDSGDNMEDTYFILMNDIDLAGYDWEPIGTFNYGGGIRFHGSINGDGHSIKNLNVNKPTAMFESGLVSELGAYGEIKNLTIASGKVVGQASVGSFAAMCTGLIENCTNYAEVHASSPSEASGYCGGITGSVSASTETGQPGVVRKCINYGYVESGNGHNGYVAGGIAGQSQGLIELCANYAMVQTYITQCGGITGACKSGSIRNCYNRGEVRANEQCGGIVGRTQNDNDRVYITNCYNAAAVADADGNIPTNSSCKSILGSAGGIKYSVLDSVYNDEEKNLAGFDDIMVPGGPTGTICLLGEEVRAYTTAEMANNQEFVDRLNTACNNAWAMDTQNINEGYPVFAFQNPETPGVGVESEVSEDVSVYSFDGRIFVLGTESDVVVYSITGTVVFNGSPKSLLAKSFGTGVYLVSVDGTSRKVVVE